jgi:arginine decarboxylase
MPLHRLHEPLDDIATLVDVTCDSDGKIDRFVDLRDVKETIELPKWRNGEEYYLGIFLVGAYQEVMGSYHNLFGIPNEAQVVLDQDGSHQVLETVEGSRIDDMVGFARYDASGLVEMFRRRIFRQVADGFIGVAEANRLVESYQQAADGSTYLE